MTNFKDTGTEAVVKRLKKEKEKQATEKYRQDTECLGDALLKPLLLEAVWLL